MTRTDGIISLFPTSQIAIEKAIDCILTDEQNKSYIDFESGVWSANLGHSHPDIVETIVNQANKTIHQGYRFTNKHALQLSTLLLDRLNLTGGACTFLNSGSEAVNLAITIAKHLTKRQKIVIIDRSYLSAFGHGALSDSNPDIVRIAIEDAASVAQIDFSEIAAFVFEPGTSGGFIRFSNNEFIELLVKEAASHRCLLIVDEVTTGMGRTGKHFGFQHYNIVPDIVAIGKGLGNGYPLSAVALSPKINTQFNTHSFRYAQSHQNDPLGCAVALKVCELLTQDMLDSCCLKGAYFLVQLEALKIENNNIIGINGRGLMLSIQLERNIDAMELANKLFEMGFYVGAKENVLRFMPPLTITVEQIDALITALKFVIGDLR